MRWSSFAEAGKYQKVANGISQPHSGSDSLSKRHQEVRGSQLHQDMHMDVVTQ